MPLSEQESKAQKDAFKAIFKAVSGHFACTCETCPLEDSCEFSWDPYNSNGDCLAQK